MSENYIKELKKRALASLTAADHARETSLSAYRTKLDLSNKSTIDGSFDPVTDTEFEIEELCRTVVSDDFPDDSIVSEEMEEIVGDSGWSWYIDPIDGTRAYLAGLPTWSTLIGIMNPERKFSYGLVDIPALDERYYGYNAIAQLKHKGKTRDIRVSDCNSLNQAIIATTDPFIFSELEQKSWQKLRESARLVRYGLDAYAYARLAAGTIDLVAESGLLPWDMCALVPLIRCAGGIACDWDGSEPKIGGRLICAATQPLMDDALTILNSL